jgi:hypothetical protein
MKVSTLINILQHCKPDAQVRIADCADPEEAWHLTNVLVNAEGLLLIATSYSTTIEEFIHHHGGELILELRRPA